VIPEMDSLQDKDICIVRRKENLVSKVLLEIFKWSLTTTYFDYIYISVVDTCKSVDPEDSDLNYRYRLLCLCK
jgi:hypothetical protein